jgi:CheY-like chemotaxis protein
MDDDTKGRIFEPFYTTKLQGRGLGMAAVYGIVKNHDGWIGVESALSRGTSVRILWPVLTGVLQKDKEKIIPDAAKGPGAILIIDDEDDVLEVSRSILERLGYTVLEARTGEDAIEIANNFDEEIDLAILDIGLPDIPGERLSRMIKEIRPTIKILVSTGYAVEDIVDNLKREAQGFIQKPISIQTKRSAGGLKIIDFSAIYYSEDNLMNPNRRAYRSIGYH